MMGTLGCRSPCSSSASILTSNLFTFSFLASQVMAAIVPTAPWDGNVFRVGQECSLQYNLDTTGTWTNFAVDLMSGSDAAMTVVTRVAQNQDGTSGSGSLSFPCPSVEPNSAIYFYQFTVNEAQPTWTTRFTIAAADGSTTRPEHQSQASGNPWGTGALVGSYTPVSGNAAGAASSAITSAPDAVSSASPASSALDSMPTSVTDALTSAAAPTETSATDAATMTDSSSDVTASPTETATDSSASPTSTSLNETNSPGQFFFSNWPLAGRIGLFAGVGVVALILIILLIWLSCCCCRRKKNSKDANSAYQIPAMMASPQRNRATEQQNQDYDYQDNSFESMNDDKYAAHIDPYYANSRSQEAVNLAGHGRDSVFVPVLPSDYNEKCSPAPATTNHNVDYQNVPGYTSQSLATRNHSGAAAEAYPLVPRRVARENFDQQNESQSSLDHYGNAVQTLDYESGYNPKPVVPAPKQLPVYTPQTRERKPAWKRPAEVQGFGSAQ